MYEGKSTIEEMVLLRKHRPCNGNAEAVLFLLWRGDWRRYATFSKRFIMMNMKAALRRQRTMNTVQTTHSGRSPQR